MSSPAAPTADAPKYGDDLRFPLGKLVMPVRFDSAWRGGAIASVARTPWSSWTLGS